MEITHRCEQPHHRVVDEKIAIGLIDGILSLTQHLLSHKVITKRFSLLVSFPF